jgi:hypothetical protein
MFYYTGGSYGIEKDGSSKPSSQERRIFENFYAILKLLLL